MRILILRYGIEGDSSLTEGAKVTGTLLNAPFGQGNIRMVPQITKNKASWKTSHRQKQRTAMEIKLLANGEELQPDIPLYLTKDSGGARQKDLIVYCELDDGSIKAVNPEISGEFPSLFVRGAGTFVIANPKENDLTEIEITAKPKKRSTG